MAIDVARVSSRRALLAGALGGLATVAAEAIGRPRAAQAGVEYVQLGAVNSASVLTKIERVGGSPSLDIADTTDGAVGRTSVQGGWGLGGVATGTNGIGLRGQATGTDGRGVHGESSGQGGIAVRGLATGTNGHGVSAGTSGHHSQVAVVADGSNGNGEGIAVLARTKNGIALYGEILDGGGYALQAVGRAVFSRSGKVTFNAGQASKTITGHVITPASLVVATIQGAVAGTWVRGVVLNDGADTFAIKLNKPAPSSLTVGWFIVN